MKNEKNQGFLNTYFEFIADPEGLSQEEVIQSLKDEGINIDQTKIKINRIVKTGLEERRLAWSKKAQQKRSLLEKIFLERKISFPNHLKEKIEELLIVQGQTQLTEAYFRKKENLSENDIRNLINDIEELNLLDEFFKEKDNDNK